MEDQNDIYIYMMMLFGNKKYVSIKPVKPASCVTKIQNIFKDNVVIKLNYTTEQQEFVRLACL